MDDATTQPMSRQERREARRAQQQSSQASQGRRRIGRRILIWGIGLALIGGLGWGMVYLAGDVQLPNEAGGMTVPVSDSDLSQGPSDAVVTLVEYSDFQCPACAAFHPVIKQLLADPQAQGKVRFVYRHFPLPMHKNARLAAQAAQAANLQGKFWEFHDKLFDGQDRWGAMSSQGARDAFKAYAEELTLDVPRWDRDVDSDVVKDKISADMDGATSANVTATPTFFVNGARMPQVASYEEFKQYVLNAAGVTPNVTP